jgi:hypothetical protein
MNMILCKCGCGEMIPEFDKRGRPRSFVMGHWMNLHPENHFKKGNPYAAINGFKKGNNIGPRFKKGIKYPWLYEKGDKHYKWKGGKRKTIQGYIVVRCECHPAAIREGYYVAEHRLVMEQYLGRYLTKEELVHHINGIKDDNRIENLQVVTQEEHNAIHNPKRKVEAPYVGS